MNKKILVTIFTLIFVLILGVTVQAKSSENLLKEEVEFYANSFDENDLNVLSDLKEKAISENLNFNVYINEMGNLSPFQIERKLEELQNK